MDIFTHESFDDHESVHVFTDPKIGLKVFIAVHSTHCGPSAGGVRFWSYEHSGEALNDVLRLSRGMSYKNAMAGLKLGGGKAVLMKPAGEFDRAELFAAYGRCVETLGGKYYTAEDVGVTTDDMRVVHGQTQFVAGLDDGEAASGDPSPVTADGVFRCIRLAVRKKMNSDLNGKTIAVQGLGHVGYHVCRLLNAAGASLIVTDIHTPVLQQAQEEFGAKIVEPDAIYAANADVFAPCALGAVINPQTIDQLNVKAVAGAANNQLSTPHMGQKLHANDILYCPDYVVNAGGIINIAGEIEGRYDPKWVEDKLCGIETTLSEIIDQSIKTGRSTDVIADEMAAARIGRAGKI
jgi:leucine dehydrogenase